MSIRTGSASEILMITVFLLLSLISCNDRSSQIFLDDLPPPEVTEGGNPCVNFDKSTDENLSLAEALLGRHHTGLFTTWVKMLEEEDPDLYDRMGGRGSFTLMLPTNAAVETFLAAYPELEIGSLAFYSMVKHHILIEPISFTGFSNTVHPAMNREMMPVQKDSENCVFFKGKSRIIVADDICTNGYIHVVDQVIIPNHGFR